MIDETVEEISEMQTHSSSVVAVKAARALSALADREFPTVEEYVRALERNSSALRRADPSHASLHTTQREIVSTVTEADLDSVPAAKDLTLEVIDRVVDRVESAKEDAAANCADRLSDGETVLTHDYSSTVLAALESAAADGKSLTVYATEARPRYIGRKTARTLADVENVEVHLIVDSASGHYLPECDCVLVGMDCIVDDTLYNRVGTYPIAATAANEDVPFYVVGSSDKVVESGFVFKNEHRSTSEVMREPAEGFVVENPGYDGTPVALIDAVVTDEGTQQP
ncbi:translation initiation factor eIF-2B [Haloarculaceae archaeon H-GB2-1]|nr:translation initiation factor eIF-2B [Haloarculaceae archaeon H-GB1-1]MEA5387022.1 translation initiation factor eIF-2B [Haloarculaceae archaeon H-GB11]MEA5408524.1 translation initiation factor eIF-2B [Haloarculaceae archaeon H-GB2-1]